MFFPLPQEDKKRSEILGTKIPVFFYFTPIGIPFLVFLAFAIRIAMEARDTGREGNHQISSRVRVHYTEQPDSNIQKRNANGTRRGKNRRSKQSVTPQRKLSAQPRTTSSTSNTSQMSCGSTYSRFWMWSIFAAVAVCVGNGTVSAKMTCYGKGTYFSLVVGGTKNVREDRS